MNILNYLTQDQLDEIIEVIKDRCNRFRTVEDLFYEPYTCMRAKHTLTSAVISGFSPNDLEIEGLSSKNVFYGIGNKMAQPEISNENAIFQIYSDGASLENQVIKDRCADYNSDNTPPIFFIIRYKANRKNLLKSIDVCFLNKDATIIETHNIYTV
ncbi:MAG: hypothetical protein J6M17_09670 [Ruminococcus sp.]|nr:hypothetical protein [Ruminococcus sp.]